MSLIKKSPTDENVKGYEGSNFYASSYIYDSDYKSKHINDITGDTSIICILEVIGLKFSSNSFHL